MTRTSKRAIRPGFDNLEGRQLLSNVLGGAAVNHTPAAVEYRNHPVANPRSPTAPPYALAAPVKIEINRVQGGDHTRGTPGTWRETWEYTEFDAVRLPLWHYYLEIDWTSDGKRITRKDAHAWGTVNAPLWTIAGATNKGYGGVGSKYFRVFSQGHFQLHIPKIGPIGGGVVQDVYPVLDETVEA